MKSILIFLTSVLLSTASLAETNKWMKVESSPNHTYYLNPAFMFVQDENKKIVRFWVRAEITVSKTKEGLTKGDSIKTLNYAKCTDKQHAIKEIYVYKKSGVLFDKQIIPSLKYENIVPNTIQSIVVSSVCDDLFLLRKINP